MEKSSEHYNEKEALDEAFKLQEKIKTGEAKDYSEAEEKLNNEEIFKQRQEMGEKLSEMPPLYEEKEYQKNDPDGLLKKILRGRT